jgi:hypothetical protein
VNDGRAEKKTFFLQSSVLDLEAACSQEANEILDGDVPLTDLRELALILAYHRPELLAEAAREWGAESALIVLSQSVQSLTNSCIMEGMRLQIRP